MKNKWVLYGFLAVLVTALVTLAILQYHWLGRVSDAERNRLEENLDASSANFISDLNEVFSVARQVFRIQVSGENADMNSKIGEAYANWRKVSRYPGMVDSIYLVINLDENEYKVFQFKADPDSLIPMKPSPGFSEWLASRTAHRREPNGSSFSVSTEVDFGDPTYLSIPVQHLQLLTLLPDSQQNMEIKLNLTVMSDRVVLKLNDSLIKEQIIPDLARTYFSDSYDDQYYLALTKPGKNSRIYYTNASDSADLGDPDLKRSLRQREFTSVILSDIPHGDSLGVDLSTENVLQRNLTSVAVEKHTTVLSTDSSERTGKWIAKSEQGTLNAVSDTNMAGSFFTNLQEDSWELWLKFREGSLDAYVSKTKIRNMVISFGILLILGISGGLIVLFSQRSKELADQQMLFVAGVSHELRTPITVIRSAAENLSAGLIHSDDRRDEYAGLMLKEGRRLSDIVDQIMEFSGIQSGKKVYQTDGIIGVNEFVEEIKKETEPLLQEKSMKLEYAVSTRAEQMQGDFDALVTGVMNLIQNAIKFSPEKGNIRFRIEDTEWKGEPAIQVAVQDFGCGIPDDEKKEIFKPFFRGQKPVDEQTRGNGIGLSLVKKIVEAHHGEIQVSSKVGVGSTFKMILPGRHDR